MYRHVILLWDNIPPVHVLETRKKEGEPWKWQISTQDKEYFDRHVAKRKLKIRSTIEMKER